MQVGVALPSMVPGVGRDTLLAWMRGIDEGPFSVLAAGERIGYPNQEMWALLAASAALTERVRIEASVSVLPMHAEVSVAKRAATIDVLSDGRFVLGVGVGGRRDDYRLLGTDDSFDRRFALLDEQIGVVRSLWRGEAAPGSELAVGPRPVQPGGPMILTASMGPRSMARSARWADGIAGFDLGPSVDMVEATFRRFEAAWDAADRTGAPFLQTSFWFGFGADAPEQVRSYATRYLANFGADAAESMASLCAATDARAVADLLARIEDTGCDEVILAATTGDLDDLARAADLVAGR